MATGCKETGISLDQFILDTLRRPLLGLPAHMIGNPTWLHSHFLGMIIEAHSRRLAAADKFFDWPLETFPEYHVLIVYPVNRINPYLRLKPSVKEFPDITVSLLLLPRFGSIEVNGGNI